MPKIIEHIEIAAPTTTVFRACHDVNRPKWDVRMKRFKLITSTPIRQGTLFQADATAPSGAIFGWEGEFAELKYPSNAVLRVLDAAPSSPFKSGTETWRFDTTGKTTKVTLTWEYQSRNVIARILDWIGGRAVTRRAIRLGLANLKKMIESD